jgi:hypothetical protein
MIVLSQEKLDEITKIKMETTEILCLEIDTRKNAHKSTIYIGTKSGKIEVYIFHVRNMKLARIYVFSLKNLVFKTQEIKRHSLFICSIASDQFMESILYMRKRELFMQIIQGGATIRLNEF